MSNKILERIKNNSSLKTVIISGVIFLVFIVLFLTKLTPVEKMICEGLPENALILDLEPGYSPERAYDILSSLNESGRNTYFRNILTIDIAFPIIYGTFLSFLISLFISKARPKRRYFDYLILLPFIVASFDIVENITISILVKSYPLKLVQLSEIANFMTLTKLSLSLPCVLVILYLSIWLIIKRCKNE